MTTNISKPTQVSREQKLIAGIGKHLENVASGEI